MFTFPIKFCVIDIKALMKLFFFKNREIFTFLVVRICERKLGCIIVIIISPYSFSTAYVYMRIARHFSVSLL